MISIPLTKGFSSIIDDIDGDLAQFKWHVIVGEWGNYARRKQIINGKQKTFYMHREILGRILGRNLDRKELVDHKNRNGLDNQRDNIRLATTAQNAMNSGIRKNKTSPYKGVYWVKRDSKWASTIKVGGKSFYLGIFVNPEDAHKAYCEASEKYHGEFARFE